MSQSSHTTRERLVEKLYTRTTALGVPLTLEVCEAIRLTANGTHFMIIVTEGDDVSAHVVHGRFEFTRFKK